MINVMLIDDEKPFIELFKQVPIEECQLHTFSNPVEAIKAVGDIQPNIIISDVQMPGVHGVDFSVIAKSIIKPEEFIYISANSKEDIEKDYGALGTATYFRKPLGEDFYDYIDNKIIECQKKIKDEPTKKKDEVENFNNVQTKIDKIQSLKKLTSEWHQMFFRMMQEGSQTPLPLEHIQYQITVSKLDVIQEIYGLSNKDFKDLTYNLIDIAENWETKANKMLGFFLSENPKIVFEEYIYISFEYSKLKIKSIEFFFNKESSVYQIKINDNIMNSDDTNHEKNLVVSCLNLEKYKKLLNNCRFFTTQHLPSFWNPDMKKNYSIEFPKGYNLETNQTIFKITKINNELYFSDKDDLAHKIKIPPNQPIPSESILCGENKIRVILESDNKIKIFNNKTEIILPLDEYINENLKKFSNSHGNYYLKKRLTIEFAWKIAMGESEWKSSSGKIYSFINKKNKILGVF